MICRENVILYDKYGTFLSIRDRLPNNNRKSEEIFYPSVLSFQNYLALKNGRENGKEYLCSSGITIEGEEEYIDN